MDPNPLGLLSVSLTFQEGAEALTSLTSSLDETQVDSADPQDWIDETWSVGLDNVYRFSPGPFGIPIGYKGEWESEETFVLYVDYTGNARRDQVRFTFQGDEITIQSAMEGVVNGRLEE
jgi:hypothetical protein